MKPIAIEFTHEEIEALVDCIKFAYEFGSQPCPLYATLTKLELSRDLMPATASVTMPEVIYGLYE